MPWLVEFAKTSLAAFSAWMNLSRVLGLMFIFGSESVLVMAALFVWLMRLVLLFLNLNNRIVFFILKFNQ